MISIHCICVFHLHSEVMDVHTIIEFVVFFFLFFFFPSLSPFRIFLLSEAVRISNILFLSSHHTYLMFSLSDLHSISCFVPLSKFQLLCNTDFIRIRHNSSIPFVSKLYCRSLLRCCVLFFFSLADYAMITVRFHA